MRKKAGGLLLICAGIGMWISCGKNANHYLYAGVPGTNQILAYREDPNSGILTQLSLSPIAAGLGVQSLVVHPSNQFLYAANSTESDVSLFTISSDGALNEVLPRATVGVAPTLLAMDPAGNFLYVANSGSGDISVFSIASSSGTLTQVTNSPFPVGFSPIDNMKLAPSGNVLYVTGEGSTNGEIGAFSVNSGVLTLIGFFATGNNPNGLAISPNGNFLYTANSLDNSISEFSTSNGSLTQLSGSPIGQTNTNPLDLLIDKSGSYLCVANEGANNISVYSIGSNGSLTALQTSPFASDTAPAFIGSDPSAEYLFVGTQSSPAIQSFGLSGSGTLTAVASYPVVGTPTSIVVVP
jgi:6-phosphogluconolactonase